MQIKQKAKMKRILLPIFIIFYTQSLFTQNKLFTKLTPNQSGIEFVNDVKVDAFHNIFASDYFYNGGGVAIGDLNNDGLQDIVLTGNRVDSKIYFNKGDLEFEDVSEKLGFNNDGQFVTGVTLVDINADGYLDIYLSTGFAGVGDLIRNKLWINKEGKGFKEESEKYGLDIDALTTQVSFFDYDKDGDLDMYCLTRPRTGFDKHIIDFFSPFVITTDTSLNRDDMTKEEFEYLTRVSDKFFVNEGGKFSEKKNIGLDEDRSFFGLNVMTVDLDNDGWTDIFTTSDYASKDLMYMNQGDGTFKEIILESMRQTSNNSMGSDINDYDNDTYPDIVVLDMTANDNKRLKANMSGMDPDLFYYNLKEGNHYEYMFNTLQRNNGNNTYSQIGFLAGIATTDWSWAPLFADFDNDADKDLFITNGIKYDVRWTDITDDFNDVRDMWRSLIMKVDREELIAESEFEYNYNKIVDAYKRKFKVLGMNYENAISFVPSTPIPNFVYENDGDLSLNDVSQDWGLNDEGFSNGASYGDLDNDGDLDLVVNNTDDYSFIYRNNSNKLKNNNFVNFKFEGPKGNSFGLNSKVYVYTGKTTQYQELTLTRGFLSSVEPVLHFGVGKYEKIDSIKVVWLDNKIQKIKNLDVNKTLTLKHSESIPNTNNKNQRMSQKLFTKVENNKIPEHSENIFNDYSREVLLPHQMSKFGPGISVVDMNNDGRSEFYLSGTKGNAGEITFLFDGNKFFSKKSNPFEQDKNHEDMGSLFFDADGDGDEDLYIVSGSNEEPVGSDYYLDRFYINENGNFKKANDRIPAIKESGSVVTGADYDKDGDIDLFIGGRQIPGKYPYPSSSHILRNDGGKFTDVTKKIAPELKKIGMVSSALWTDYDNDGDRDLIIVGEWMPITIFRNDNSTFVDVSDESFNIKTNGWWWSINSGDFDNDGDIDYIAGNLGLNYKYEASQEYPFIVYSDDFDHNGSNDIVLSYFEQGVCYPLRGRSCSSQQIPEIKKKFPTYNLFSEATVTDVYGEEDLNNALELKAYHFASSYLENNGDGTFEVKELPELAQISTMFGIAPMDYDGDGNLDVLTAGNFHEAEIETPRADASIGLLLKGDGSGNFKPMSHFESGFFARENTKGISLVKAGNKEIKAFVLNNGSKLEVFDINKPDLKQILSAEKDVEKAEHFYEDGSKRMQELYFGSGYLTQSSRMVIVTDKHSKIILHKTDGTTETLEFSVN